ncbi:MAG: hypothetical protein JNL67_15185 [Planctomycetaceae bacterium]|nr:hypothetical protein [Planctomycetaceae bacterium]
MALEVFVESFSSQRIDYKDMQVLAMQIDAAVKLISGIEESHLVSPWVRVP